MELSHEFKEINEDQDVLLYTENIGPNVEQLNFESKYNAKTADMKKHLLSRFSHISTDLMKKAGVGAEKFANFTRRADATSGFLAKSAQVSRSEGHAAVKQIGSALGVKFKPWQAVNITKNLGNVAKYVGPALSVAGVGISVVGAVKEEREIKTLVAAKNQANLQYGEVVDNLINAISEKFKAYITENVDSKLEQCRIDKLQIMEQVESNSKLLKDVQGLTREYDDFIDVINV